ncbi:MAG: sugar transporter [Gammaproteobacteria bacterium]|nr:sugar transporter [Gammaproteobacteria bacterium]MBU1831393.1 sugar transporter [Gammaproteobacteria bacterium]
MAFMIITVLPSATTFWYLYTRAADQYASTLAFTVRSDETTSATDLLGGLGKTLGGGSAARDSDILNEFILSQEIVRIIDRDINLEEIYSKETDKDPILGYHSGGPIENLETYWGRMVRVSHDSSSGLMELRVLAFRPEDAMAIANAIYDESSKMINQLSQSAREDATRYAEEDLAAAVERLKSARDSLTSYRLANQIVDPNADIQAQMGLLTTLQTQQASALIEYDLISENGNANDPRVEQARRRLDVIESRIAEERRKFGVGGGDDGGVEYATTISEFESLTVDREFAQAAYAAALQALDGARADANRKSRYLAAYIKPTIAEKSQFPQRNLILFVITGFAFLIWAILSLVYYALRDRN